jgi:hypothetical protein
MTRNLYIVSCLRPNNLLGQPLHLGRKNKRLKQALKIKIIYITATIKAPGSGRLLII